MSQQKYIDHSGLGYECRHLYVAQYLSEADWNFDKTDSFGGVTNPAGSSRNLDGTVHEVDLHVREVPYFWKPCEDWDLD